jgi:ferredoxin
MPWINSELCTGCELCVGECPVGAISMEKGTAFIQEEECIRCGVCHGACPAGAVRHDGDRIPLEVQANLDSAKNLLSHEYYSNDKAKQKQLIEKLKRLYNRNKTVAERTIEQLEILKNKEYAE